MKLDTQLLLQKLHGFVHVIQRYLLIIGALGFGLIAAYILHLTNAVTQQQPDQQSILEEAGTQTRLKIDPEIAKTMEDLEDQNITIQTIFDQARSNPFDE